MICSYGVAYDIACRTSGLSNGALLVTRGIIKNVLGLSTSGMKTFGSSWSAAESAGVMDSASWASPLRTALALVPGSATI